MVLQSIEQPIIKMDVIGFHPTIKPTKGRGIEIDNNKFTPRFKVVLKSFKNMD